MNSRYESILRQFVQKIKAETEMDTLPRGAEFSFTSSLVSATQITYH
jgi:hypothetical protein